jgi:molybdate transport system permease protein
MMFHSADLIALALTFKLASITTFILLLIGTPLAWWLANTPWRFKFLIEAVVAMPLMLPPTVLGFYLLIALGNHGPIGQLVEWLGGQPPAFTFTGLVIGSVIYSMPFVVQPLQSAFRTVGRRPLEVAATLRASPWDRFFTVAVPLAGPGFLTAAVLGFAHTIGEFGVVLMIGGNIPGETKVVSIAIYDHVEGMDYHHAHVLSAALMLLSFVLLAGVYFLNRRLRMVQL